VALMVSGVLTMSPPAEAVGQPVLTGRVTTSTEVPLDNMYVEACPPGTAHRFSPVCDGGFIVQTSVFNGTYTLPVAAPGDWSVKAVGLWCSAPYLSPSVTVTVSGSTSLDLVLDTGAFVPPAATDLAPPFVDGADPAGETNPDDGVLHLPLRDTSREILIGGAGGFCVNRHVPYRPLQTVVFKPEGAGPFPLVVLSHGGGESAVSPGRAGRAPQLVGRGYAVAVPTYPLTAAYPGWPGGYLRDIDDQAIDLTFILGELLDLPFVDGDRIGLTGVSAGGYTSIVNAFHSSGYDGGLRAVATEIARPLTAPTELLTPVGRADVPLFMANNVDDQVTAFAPADAFWQAAAAPKYRWLEDTDAVIPSFDHGFSTTEPAQLIDLFLDAYVLGDPAARAALNGHADPPGADFTYQAVPAPVGYTGPLARPVSTKVNRTVPITVQLWADVGGLTATVTGPTSVPSIPLTFDRRSGTYDGLLRTKDLARGTYTVSTATPFGTFTQTVTVT
jgi:dienelactone hydrolase